MDSYGAVAREARSHGFPQAALSPVSASTLLDQEIQRKAALQRRGNLLTGCTELDKYVMLGGFDRGTVVGVSAEKDEIGLLIGLQTLAHLLTTKGTANNHSGNSKPSAVQTKAMIITTLSVAELLPRLREVLVSQVATLQGGLQNVQAQVQSCLERISIARVFDIEGLLEVLGDLDNAGSVPNRPSETKPEPSQAVKTEPKPAPNPRPSKKTVILDSEHEDDGLSSPPSSCIGQELQSPLEQPTQPENPTATRPLPPLESNNNDMIFDTATPDLILISNMTTLLNALFTGRDDKPAAHNSMLLLSSRLRHITRSAKHGGPVIMLFNSTTSATSFTESGGGGVSGGVGGDISVGSDRQQQQQQPDQSLRSIFNNSNTNNDNNSLPVPEFGSGPGVHGTRNSGYGSNSVRYHSNNRRNKPSFGIVFAQLLDVHLLCTRVPRSAGAQSGGGGVYPVWVVEVLLDEVGVYDDGIYCDGDGEVKATRRCREQRWGAVEVDEGGGMIMDALRGSNHLG
ncbi:hypothetical protein B0T17DRAFT_614480 [Bombardia bombarda]|uniref:Uncharacterized protein n=1 Tax=Bombardia bombarda TaxID=252184 RepID=A0AA39X773_9PEZI|nr:hypothetical protein B0T17DRAFT_614480 [Bombardia bombarda]